MTIKYNISSNRNLAGAKAEYRVIFQSRMIVNLEDISKSIANETAFNSCDVRGVAYAIREKITSELLNGNCVRIDGLGTFSLTLASDGEINPSKYVSHKVYVKNVRFSSSKKVKDTLSFAKFERVKNNFASEPDLQTKRLNRIIEWLKIKDGICTSDVMDINN